MKRIILTMAAASLAVAGSAQTLYDAYDPYWAGVLAGGSATYNFYGTTAGGFLANQITLSSLGTVTGVDVVVADGNTSAISPTVTYVFYANTASNTVGAELASFSETYTNLAAGSVNKEVLTLSTPIDLASLTSSTTIWFGFTSNAGYTGVGDGYVPTTGTSSGMMSLSANGTSWTPVTPNGSKYDFAVSFIGSPAPEPVSLAILGFGAVGLMARRRTKR